MILEDLGVGRNTWWGYTLHTVFDNLRVPFTAVGFRYDLNHGKWTGPDSGNGYAVRVRREEEEGRSSSSASATVPSRGSARAGSGSAAFAGLERRPDAPCRS